ncbi:MAG: HAD-IA family hydrolase [Jatrophihabitans sp.]|uniref:HAD-IA family hydrolase n=1 Tax=Jatrophihabitans sp. TaxID=1932789 RepID=UPI003F7EB834
MTPPVVLFDLDGTLSDSAPGILASLRHAFATHGLPPLDATTERALLGPPFYESLPPLLGDVDVMAVIGTYREHYAAGAMYDTSPYPGVGTLLRALHADGVRVAVATSKPEHYAVPIVERLGYAPFFETVGGDDLHGTRRTKADVIAEVLRRLGHPEPDDVVMVGDRSHDVEGARAHHIRCVGVRWGYALEGELEAAAPVGIVADAAALQQTLRTLD